MDASEDLYAEAKVIQRRLARLGGRLPAGDVASRIRRLADVVGALAEQIDCAPIGCTGAPPVLTAGPLMIDLRTRTARVHECMVPLSRLEFGLLALLARDPERLFSKEEIGREVWGMDMSKVRTRTIDSHASRLRAKLREVGMDGVIVNRWGQGYALRAPSPTRDHPALMAA